MACSLQCIEVMTVVMKRTGKVGNGNAAKPGKLLQNPDPKKRPRIAVYLPNRLTSIERRELEQLARNAGGSDECKNVLVLAATEQPAGLTRLPGLDFVTVPTLHTFSGTAKSPANVSQRDRRTLDIRSNVLAAALEAYCPDILIVSRLPRGLGDELLASLATLRADTNVHCVLELNVELDEPHALQREWHDFAYSSVLESLYDSVWVRSSDAGSFEALVRTLPGLSARAVMVPAPSSDGVGSSQLAARIRGWLSPSRSDAEGLGLDPVVV
jgi:predicted glycosyltransferase